MRAILASEERCRARATSSRQALASLSTRAGRALSRPKLTVQRLEVVGAGAGGCGGGGGWITFTVVVADCVLPLSSATLQVTVIGPGAAPEVDRVALELVPLILP